MINFAEVLHSRFFESVGITLLHSLWQGLVVAACFELVVRLFSRSANLRYLIGCVAMMLMLVLPMTTFHMVHSLDDTATVRPPGRASGDLEQTLLNDTGSGPPRSKAGRPIFFGSPMLASPEQGVSADAAGLNLQQHYQSSLRSVAPWFALGWCAGVVLLSLRPLMALHRARKLRATARAMNCGPVFDAVVRISQRLALNRAVQVAQSALVEIPTVIGHSKPLIVVPLSMATGQPTEQLAAIIAHELAHIRRYDYLVNLMQSLIETLLFYHPAMWWVSGKLRQERENCCDDIAVDLCGRRVYAQALAELETARHETRGLAIAANGGSLYLRIRRIVRAHESSSCRVESWLTTSMVVGLMLVVYGVSVVESQTTTDAAVDLDATWTLSFPEDADYGTVASYAAPEVVFGYPQLSSPKSVQAAQGDVRVRRNEFTTLTLNGRGSQDLSFLLDFPTDAVNGLNISNLELDAADFETIGRFPRLRTLNLDRCSLTEGLSIEQLAVAKELQTLRFRASSEDDINGFVHWVSRCRKAAYVYCRNRHFNAKDAARFAGHPSASFLPVSIGTDANELFAALASLPNLQALNVQVEDGVPDIHWTELKSLKKVELFNWSGGLINAELLTSFAEMESLRVLRLQSSTILAEDFPEGLKRLTKLEELTLRPRKSLCNVDEVHVALQSMPNLKQWPELEKPSGATLRALASRPGRTNVDIDQLGADATVDDLVAVLDTDTLTFVHLQDVPFTKEVAAAIEKNTRLERLILSVAEFDGSLFSRPDRMTVLDDVDLYVGNGASNLEVLSRLPALTGLQLGVQSLLPRDLSFISKCPRLTSLSVLDGYSDDTTAKLIGESKTLKRVSLLQDCYMTDAAIDSLLQNTRLEGLQIGGHITKQAAMRLGKLPRLTRLTLWSDSISEEERTSLKDDLPQLTYTDFREFLPSSGKYTVGDDQIWRLTRKGGRAPLDKLEGQHARDIFGEERYREVVGTMEGKVVLIDFWGTWCGPCLAIKPQLQQLAEKYKKNGFEVISIHSQRGLEQFGKYITTHPMQWANLLDEDGNLATAFGVRIHPSLYLFDREGVLRVAQPHRIKLEDAVARLLDLDI